LKKGHVRLAVPLLLVFFTSINYWKDATNSFNRHLDINVVLLSYLFVNMSIERADHKIFFYKMLMFGMLFYPLARYNSSKRKFWMSVVCHSLMHVFCNLANMVLFSGDIELTKWR
jgi:hypothetical protein